MRAHFFETDKGIIRLDSVVGLSFDDFLAEFGDDVNLVRVLLVSGDEVRLSQENGERLKRILLGDEENDD